MTERFLQWMMLKGFFSAAKQTQCKSNIIVHTEDLA